MTVYAPGPRPAQVKSLEPKARKSRHKAAKKRGMGPKPSNIVPFPPNNAVLNSRSPGFLAGAFLLPAGPGVWCGHENCDNPLHRFLLQPRKHPATVVVTRYPRLARAMTMMQPEVCWFCFTDDNDFLRAQSALHSRCVNYEAGMAEPALSAEETIAAAERMAGLTPGDGAPQ
jgi:hypothetical protein